MGENIVEDTLGDTQENTHRIIFILQWDYQFGDKYEKQGHYN